MPSLVAGLWQWAYGVVPLFLPAIALASAVLGVLLAPLLVLEVRTQRKALAGIGHDLSSDIGRIQATRHMVRGRPLTVILLRRAVLLAVAVLVLLAVLGMARPDPSYPDPDSALWRTLHRSGGEIPLWGTDLGTGAVSVALADSALGAVLPYLVLPALLVGCYALVGTRPLGGSRTPHLAGAGLVAVLVPGAVVIHLLVVLLVNAGVVALLTNALRPPDRGRDGSRLRWTGWLHCTLGVAAVLVGEYLTVTALPADPLSADLAALPTEPLLQAALLGMAGMFGYAKGEERRWMGQLLLSRTHAYRHDQGFPEPTGSLAALRRTLPGQSRRTGAGWMAAGGLGACGLGCVALVVGLRYGWDLVEGRGVAPWSYVVPLALGMVLMAAGNILLRAGRRHFHRVLSTPDELVPGSYTLYLRDFVEDPKLARLSRTPRPGALLRGFLTAGRSEEERLADALTWAGLPVSVGRPGERLPYTGIPRVYLPADGWQEPVRTLMRGASLVVIVLGRGPGTMWELGEAMRLLPPQRVLLLVTMARREYDECVAEVGKSLAAQADALRRETGSDWRPPALPAYPGHRSPPSRIRGLIHFTQDWTAVHTPVHRPPPYEYGLLGALDRAMLPAAVALTEYEKRTAKRHG